MYKMKVLFIFLGVILSIFLLCILFFSIKSHKFLKTIFLNAFFGLSILAIMDLTSKFTGIFIPINEFSVTGISLFGIPAVCGFLVLRIILL